MNYRLSLKAEEDLIRLYRYEFYSFGENQSDRYFDALYSCFDRIAKILCSSQQLIEFGRIIAFVFAVLIPLTSS